LISTYDAPRGETMRLRAGSTPVVFTNATPDRMCGLYMNNEDTDDYGDNWLPKEGLASGQSIEFKVQPGKYMARWDTCTSGSKQPFYAATLWREMGFVVDQETQLYAYVADTVSPTKRAAILGRDHKLVRFQGQQIGGPDWNKPQPQIAAKPAKSQQTVIASEQQHDASKMKKVNLSEFCERRPVKRQPQIGDAPPAAKGTATKGPKAKGTARVGVRGPSLKRSHDITSAKVKYGTR
jgi:hypothetical protein